MAHLGEFANTKVLGPFVPVAAMPIAQHHGAASRAVNWIGAELLHERRNAGHATLTHDVASPAEMERTGVVTAFPADNDPVDPLKIDCAKVLDLRLYREKANGSGYAAQILDAHQPL